MRIFQLLLKRWSMKLVGFILYIKKMMSKHYSPLYFIYILGQFFRLFVAFRSIRYEVHNTNIVQKRSYYLYNRTKVIQRKISLRYGTKRHKTNHTRNQRVDSFYLTFAVIASVILFMNLFNAGRPHIMNNFIFFYLAIWKRQHIDTYIMSRSFFFGRLTTHFNYFAFSVNQIHAKIHNVVHNIQKYSEWIWNKIVWNSPE